MALETGSTAPDFTLLNTQGEKVTMSDALGGHKLLLLFFPLAFTGTCTEELCTARDNLKMYNSLDTDIFAISVDSHFTLREFKKAYNLNFTLLSDFNKEVSKAYDALYTDYYGMKGVSKRASYLIGEDRTVLFSEVLEDSGRLPDFNAIVNAIRGSGDP